MKFDYLDLEAAGGCRYDYVAVYDGPLVNQSRLVGKYCGNQTAQPPVLKSRGSVLALQFRTDYSVAGGGFRAGTRFTYGERAGCGGLVRLGETGSSTITRCTQSRHNHFSRLFSLDSDGDGRYEADLNCQWAVLAPPDRVVRLRFTRSRLPLCLDCTFLVFRFELERRQNSSGHQSCWDYLEVRSGEVRRSAAAVVTVLSSRDRLPHWLEFSAAPPLRQTSTPTPAHSGSSSSPTELIGPHLLTYDSCVCELCFFL